MNIVDKDGLDSIFGAIEDSAEVVVREEFTPTSKEFIEENNSVSKKEQFVENELKVLLKNASCMLAVAKDIVETTPDAETISSASNMINSVTNLINELNRNVLVDRRFHNQAKLEQIKVDGKKDLAKFKSQLDQAKAPNLGTGNTINVQNNHYVPFNQEDIVKSIMEAEKEKIIIDITAD